MMNESKNILIVDDEYVIRKILCEKLSGNGYNCLLAANGEQALDEMKKGTMSLVILDIKMPGKSGLDILAELKTVYPDTQVLMVTAALEMKTAVQCMKSGAYDYIVKPFNLDEIAFIVSRALEKRQLELENRRLELENREYQRNLEDKVSEQAGRIRSSFMSAITSLASALEAKDKYTGGHSQRVSEISLVIANGMGLFKETSERVKLAGMVHDIGKIGISEFILNKPGHLTDDEFRHIQKHPEIGQRILVPIAGDKEILRIVRSHHEHYDGTGYPDGLKREEIPLGARIIAVADSYEAMTSERPYRSSLSAEYALMEIKNGKGTQFDPDVVEVFQNSFKNIHDIQESLQNDRVELSYLNAYRC
jgi:putative two-component system response regulator